MATQQEIADHLFVSQRTVSEMLGRMGVSSENMSLDEVRRAYIESLRVQAGNQQTSAGGDLVHERVLSERVTRELQALTLTEKRRQLVDVDQLRVHFDRMVGAFRGELQLLSSELKASIDKQHGIDVDIELVRAGVDRALEQLSRYNDAAGAGEVPSTNDA